MVLKSDLDFKTAPWPSVSEQAKDCVKKLLNRNVSERITAAGVLQHPWLTQQGLQSDKPLDNVVIQRMRQVRPYPSPLKTFTRQSSMCRMHAPMCASHACADDHVRCAWVLCMGCAWVMHIVRMGYAWV